MAKNKEIIRGKTNTVCKRGGLNNERLTFNERFSRCELACQKIPQSVRLYDAHAQVSNDINPGDQASRHGCAHSCNSLLLNTESCAHAGCSKRNFAPEHTSQHSQSLAKTALIGWRSAGVFWTCPLQADCRTHGTNVERSDI